MSYIEDINKLKGVSFDDMLNAASRNLTMDKRQAPWVGLSHGVKLLENEVEMLKYLCAYGEMHRQKINLALDAINNPSEFVDKDVTIIDWGCGQGLASVCFFDYMHNLGLIPNVVNVVLIEPSATALERAHFHLCKYVDNSIIIKLDKYLCDISDADIASRSGLVLNLFSNILDIQSVSIDHLAGIICNGITTDQINICVGPQNIGSSRISEFAQLFAISEEDLLQTYSGKLAGRGTVNLLVFRVRGRHTEEPIQAEIVKVAYNYHRNMNVENCTALQSILKNATPSDNFSTKALQFYKITVELERLKSANVTDSYPLPMHIEGKTLNVDIQENKDFEEAFKKNSDQRYTNWPKHLNIGIGVIIEDKLYRLLQYVYPYEDIKNIDIEHQFVSVSLSDFTIDSNVANELEMGEDVQEAIELLLKDNNTTKDSLESLLKDAISNDLQLDDQLLLALTSEAPALSQINSELGTLIDVGGYSPLLESFLKGYLDNNHLADVNADFLIRVVPMDESQRMAVKSAIESKVSVITGPPGTGKTQMILNLIANLMVQGKSVLIASKVNKAVDNIKERYDEVDINEYLMRFGSKETVREQVIPYLESITGKIDSIKKAEEPANERLRRYGNKHTKACELIQKGRELLLELAQLHEEYPQYDVVLARLISEKEAAEQDFSSNKAVLENANNFILDLCHSTIDWTAQQTYFKQSQNTLQRKYSGIGKFFFNLFSKKRYAEELLNHLLSLPQSFVAIAQHPTGVRCVNDVKNGAVIISICDNSLNLVDRILGFKEKLKNLETSRKRKTVSIDSQYQATIQKQSANKNRLEALSDHQSEIEQYIIDGKIAIRDDAFGREYLRAAVESRLVSPASAATVSRFKAYLPDNIPWQRDQKQTYTQNAISFLNVFRLNAVTNLSVKNCYPLESSIFDVVIVDEASQCDVASALPLLHRAKQFVVIGDPLQLRHISSINVAEEQGIKERLSISENPLLKYADHSLYDYCNSLILTADTNNRPVILEGHYRCHPQIIGFSNEFFYQKKLGTPLRVMTKEANPLLRQKGVIWQDVKGVQKSVNQNVNEAEIAKCLEIAGRLLNENHKIKIGIITPFRHQAQEINAQMPESFRERVVADTVYKFQGAERDVIIYSLVVTDNSPDSKIRWIDYSCPNLVNVAVTRAKTALYVVANRKYIRENSKTSRPLGYLVKYTEHEATLVTDFDKNTYVIDTNVFIDCPNIIETIRPCDCIVVPMVVAEELDRLKNSDQKSKAESALRSINVNRRCGRVRVEIADSHYLPTDLRKNNADNMILSVALKFKNYGVILLTSDNCLQLKAYALGVDNQSYKEFNQ